MLSRFAVVCAAAALTLTAQPVAAYAIGGGSAVTDAALRFTVKIDVGDGARSCTGALVTPWWVLTAASCAGAAAGAPAERTTVTAGRANRFSRHTTCRNVARAGSPCIAIRQSTT